MRTDEIKSSIDGIIVQEWFWSLSSEDYETPLSDLYHSQDFRKSFTICGAYKRSNIPNVSNLRQRLVFMAIHGYLLSIFVFIGKFYVVICIILTASLIKQQDVSFP